MPHAQHENNDPTQTVVLHSLASASDEITYCGLGPEEALISNQILAEKKASLLHDPEYREELRRKIVRGINGSLALGDYVVRGERRPYIGITQRLAQAILEARETGPEFDECVTQVQRSCTRLRALQEATHVLRDLFAQTPELAELVIDLTKEEMPTGGARWNYSLAHVLAQSELGGKPSIDSIELTAIARNRLNNPRDGYSFVDRTQPIVAMFSALAAKASLSYELENEARKALGLGPLPTPLDYQAARIQAMGGQTRCSGVEIRRISIDRAAIDAMGDAPDEQAAQSLFKNDWREATSSAENAIDEAADLLAQKQAPATRPKA